MSNLKTKRIQLGDHATASNNFVIRQPDTPDGKMHLGNGTLDTNSDLITVTSDGTVAVGSTNSNPFNWSGSSNAVSISANQTNTWAQLSLQGNGTGGTGINLGSSGIRHAGVFSVNGSDLSLATNTTNSGTFLTTQMTVHSQGYVTTPNQPWALVDMGGGQTYQNYAGKAPFDNIVQQNGTHYDTTNYRFTCPVAGVYAISWSILSQNASDQYHVEPHVNGTRFARSYVTYRGNRGYIEYKCSAGDYLEIYFDNGNYYPSTGTDRYTWATYRLVG